MGTQMLLSPEQKELVFKKLRERISQARAKKRIDNASLHAGSPMYYYCRLCGLLAATLSEGDFSTPIPKHCEDCDRLFKEYGLTMEEVREAIKA